MQDAVARRREVRPAIFAKCDQFAVEDGIGWDPCEFGDSFGHVPVAPAADGVVLAGADDCAEAVVLKLERPAGVIRKRP
jgi:hypothetical protein